ncbi:hypothetical protein MCOR30_011090, partial [Pyricularia oryzae]
RRSSLTLSRKAQGYRHSGPGLRHSSTTARLLWVTRSPAQTGVTQYDILIHCCSSIRMARPWQTTES